MVQTIAVITIIYASFATIIQEDTKKLIAYSSIVVILGLFSNSLKVKLSIHGGTIEVQFLFSASHVVGSVGIPHVSGYGDGGNTSGRPNAPLLTRETNSSLKLFILHF